MLFNRRIKKVRNQIDSIYLSLATAFYFIERFSVAERERERDASTPCLLI